MDLRTHTNCNWENLERFCLKDEGRITEKFSTAELSYLQVGQRELTEDKIKIVFLKIVETKDWQVFHYLFTNRSIIDQIPFKLIQRSCKAYCCGRAYFDEKIKDYSEKLVKLHQTHKEQDQFRMGMALYASGKLKGNTGKNFLVYQAVKHGHKDFLNILLKDPMVNPHHEIGYWFIPHPTPLRIACEAEKTDMIDALLKDSRVKVEEQGPLLLFEAINEGKTKVVETLLASARIDVNKGYLGDHPLTLALKIHRQDEAQLILSHPLLELTVNHLIIACSKNNLQLLKMMLAKQWIYADDIFDNPLCYAQSREMVEALELFLDDGRFDPLGTVCGNSAYYQAHKGKKIQVIERFNKDFRVKAFKKKYGHGIKSLYH